MLGGDGFEGIGQGHDDELVRRKKRFLYLPRVGDENEELEGNEQEEREIRPYKFPSSFAKA